MSAWLLNDDERAAVFREDILPLLFPNTRATGVPMLTLVTGQPGSGRAQAVARLRSELEHDVSVLSGDELRAFHPARAQLDAVGSIEAVDELGASAAEWLRAGLAYARDAHQPLIVDGSFATARVALGTAQRFAKAGFQTRIVIVGSRRAESLLSAVSLYLRGLQTGGPAHFVSRDAHDRGFDGTHALAAALEKSDEVDRVSVLGRGGATIFDKVRGHDDRPFAGATAALREAQSERLTTLRSAQWLSELRRVTEFAATIRNVLRPLTDVLIDLHETALAEIIPELPVPPGSKVVALQEHRSAIDLVALRRSRIEAGRVDAAAPSADPAGFDGLGPTR